MDCGTLQRHDIVTVGERAFAWQARQALQWSPSSSLDLGLLFGRDSLKEGEGSKLSGREYYNTSLLTTACMYGRHYQDGKVGRGPSRPITRASCMMMPFSSLCPPSVCVPLFCFCLSALVHVLSCFPDFTLVFLECLSWNYAMERLWAR